MKFKVKEFRT